MVDSVEAQKEHEEWKLENQSYKIDAPELKFKNWNFKFETMMYLTFKVAAFSFDR